MTIWIPVNAIHHDEKYYDNPEEFYPAIFLSNSPISFYLPFGLGPKICIDNRFDILMIKGVLFHLLARCKLKHCVLY